MPPQGRIPALESGTTGSRHSVSCRVRMHGVRGAYQLCIASDTLAMTRSCLYSRRAANLLRGSQDQLGKHHWNSRSAPHCSRNSPQMLRCHIGTHHQQVGRQGSNIDHQQKRTRRGKSLRQQERGTLGKAYCATSWQECYESSIDARGTSGTANDLQMKHG